MLYLNGFELGPGFSWDTVYIGVIESRSRSQEQKDQTSVANEHN